MRILSLSTTLALLLASSAALADGSAPASADTLFREGRAAADAGNYAVACPKFEESYKLDPAPGTLLNLGDCEENRGQLARALAHFREAYDQFAPSDERRAVADARAKAIERREAPPDKPIPVSTSVPPPRDAKVDASPPPPASGSGQRTAAIAVGGVGAGTLLLGTIFGGIALSHLATANGACTGNVCTSQEAVAQFHSAQSFAIATDVTVSIGVALLSTAIILLVTAPHEHDPRSARSLPLWLQGRF